MKFAIVIGLLCGCFVQATSANEGDELFPSPGPIGSYVISCIHASYDNSVRCSEMDTRTGRTFAVPSYFGVKAEGERPVGPPGTYAQSCVPTRYQPECVGVNTKTGRTFDAPWETRKIATTSEMSP